MNYESVVNVLIELIDTFSERSGRIVAWLALLMVLTQFLIVLLRYVFGIGSVMLQESIVYMHSTLFLLVAAYTLRHNGHVRCDIFYANISVTRKALIDLFGAIFFLLPMCGLIAWVSWPFVINSWSVLEGSAEGSLGMPAVYLLKTTILIFTVMLGLQGLALAMQSLLVLVGQHTESR